MDFMYNLSVVYTAMNYQYQVAIADKTQVFRLITGVTVTPVTFSHINDREFNLTYGFTV